MRKRFITLSSIAVLLLAAVVHAQSQAPRLADAAQKGDAKTVRSLLDQKADVNATQPDGMTAVHWAIERDDAEMTELLLRAGANVKAANREGVTPLYLAANNGNAPIIDKLLRAGADPNALLTTEGETALMFAAQIGSAAAVKVLLDAGANINTKQAKGQTALMWAAAESPRSLSSNGDGRQCHEQSRRDTAHGRIAQGRQLHRSMARG
jgi:ankyrin repeat protein